MNSLEPDLNNNTPTDISLTRGNFGVVSDSTTAVQFSQIERLSPIALAYIGDAVYELYVRTQFLMPPKRMADYHGQVVDQVRAETQAAYLTILTPYLTDLEKEVLRRGRNACVGRPRRLSPHIYQQATSLEALIGYLHLSDPQRLDELFAKLEIKAV